MKIRIFFTLTMLTLMTIASSAQCAMCRAVAETGNKNGQSIGGGLNNAILYLMIVPYVLLVVFFRKKIWTFLKELRGLWS
ncbi:MAG: hypothetical protein NT084_03885 [Bacteroidetes bacterium]|jgi:hypothetical protein|nr:hypothetical protein [Bacteroidota bacterium]